MAAMTRDDARQAIRQNWRSIIPSITSPAKTKVNHETSWICPFCGHGAHGDGLTVNPKSTDRNGLKCFGCDFTGDIIDLYMKYYGADYNTALQTLAQDQGITIEAYKPEQPEKPKQDSDNGKADSLKAQGKEKPVELAPAKQPVYGQYKDYIEECKARARDTLYFQKRGFTSETVEKFMLGYDPEKSTFDHATKKWVKGAITIPYSKDCSYYMCRSIEGKGFYKPNAEDAGEEPVFNVGALYKDQPCFICEGTIDAISIIQAGGNAAAVVGTGSDKLLKQIEKRQPVKPLILCFDHDEVNEQGKTPGQDAQKRLKAALEEKKIPYIEASFMYDKYGDGDKKDANDLLRGNAKQLAEDVRRNTKAALRKEPFIPYNVKEYLNGGNYEVDINYFKQYKNRKTGFENIDKYLTLYPGLAALGGSASLGKTTFAVNLADNLLQAGETILYFALEQEPIEIVTKSLARRLGAIDPTSPIKNIDIKNGATSAMLEAVKKEYAEIAGRFIIVRCNFTTTAVAIRKYVESFIKMTGSRPVVFIDYLQLISPPEDFRADNVRTATDYNIKSFKTMQTDNELLVVMISNFNRGSYSTPVSYEAFKETGMIEYTCDYVWGLQLTALEDDKFFTRTGKNGGQYETNVKTKNDKLYDATSALIKDVEFVSLKSRNGKQSYKCFFKYDMPFDTFIPDLNNQYDRNGGNGFATMPKDFKSPFENNRL